MSIGKLKIIIHRLIWFLLLFAGVICFLIQLDNIDSDNSAAFYSLYFIISYCDIAIALPFFIGSLNNTVITVATLSYMPDGFTII